METTQRHNENRRWPQGVQDAVFKVETMLEEVWTPGWRCRILLWGTTEFGVRVAEVDFTKDRAGACFFQSEGEVCFRAERMIVALMADPSFHLPMNVRVSDDELADAIEYEVSQYRWQLFDAMGIEQEVATAYFDRHPIPECPY